MKSGRELDALIAERGSSRHLLSCAESGGSGSMSGGSYNYFYSQIDDFADSLRRIEKDPRRIAFQKLMRLIANACHDIEWVDSCDYGDEGDHEAIDKVFAFLEASPEIIKKAHAYDSLKLQLQEFLK